MPVTKSQYDAIFKIARTDPCNIVLDKTLSSSYEVILVHRKKDKRWSVDQKGKVRRVVPTT